ncbi:MAG: DUF350 domain-containing protein [Verrucomicrobiota bacterium]|nr:DUF350 domain-containing protein [Verrucomicrobiota bacterium]
MISITTLAFMDVFFSSFFSLLVNVFYASLTTLLAVGILWVVDRHVFKNIDFVQEIQKGNIAAAIFAGFFLLSVCLLLSFTMR